MKLIVGDKCFGMLEDVGEMFSEVKKQGQNLKILALPKVTNSILISVFSVYTKLETVSNVEKSTSNINYTINTCF